MSVPEKASSLFSKFKLTLVGEVSGNTTAAFGEDLPVNSTGGAVTITAPSNPVANNMFGVIDSRAQSAINNIIVDFGSDNFYGSTGTDTLNTNGAHTSYKYIDSTIGWVREL